MKSYQIVFEPEALEEIEIAFSYYDEIYGNLSQKFAVALNETLAQIKQNPFYQVRYNSIIRLLKIKKFPYTIHYTINELYDEIHILALIHTASDPDKSWLWQEE